MDIIQSNEIKGLFTTTHKDIKITVEILEGGKKFLCNITIKDFFLGRFDLLSNKSLSNAYKRFEGKLSQSKKYFHNPDEFINTFLDIAQKIRNNEYSREGTKIKYKLTHDAKSFLQSVNLIDKMDYIQRHTTHDPLVDSWEDLLLFSLVVVSCKTTYPITYEHTGPSSSGKTYPAEHAVNGFPEVMILSPAGATDTAHKYNYDYQDPETKAFVNITGEKCIYIREKEDSMGAVKFFKQMMSHDKDELSYLVTGKNQVTGAPETTTYIMKGIPSFILLSVKHLDDEEMSSRTMKGSPTVSNDKTGRIIRDTFYSDTIREIWKPPKDLRMMHDSMYSLKKYHVVNIFGGILGDIFPKDDMRRCRDMNRLRGLIQASAVLHQYQRCYEVINGNEQLLYASLEDNLIALILIDRLLESTVLGVPKTSLQINDVMKEMEEKNITLSEVNIHEHTQANGIRMTLESLKDTHLKTLLNHQMIRIKTQGGRGKVKSYKINKRFEDIYKVAKLTPVFIEELQKHYQDIIKKYEDEFVKFNAPPDVSVPNNVIELLDGHSNSIVKYLFGLNYFGADLKQNVLHKICSDKMRDILYNDKHILEQSVIHTEREQIKDTKDKAIDDIVSGKSADEHGFEDELYRQWMSEQKEKYKQI